MKLFSTKTKPRKGNVKKSVRKSLPKWYQRPKYLAAILFILLFASVGVWQLVGSKAAVIDRGTTAYMSTYDGCWLAGRVWSSTYSKCLKKCRSSGSSFIAATSTHLGYCSGAIAPAVSLSGCTYRGRRFVNNTGCSRRIDQKVTAGAKQCRWSNNTYFPAGSNPDYCGLICNGTHYMNITACPATTTTTTTSSTSINTTSLASVNSAYINMWASGTNTVSGWTGDLSSCALGIISGAAIQTQLNAINYARALNGLDRVTGKLDGPAESAAVMMAANGQVSHNPPSTWKCYTSSGATAAGQSVLALAAGMTPLRAIRLYLDDPGASNTAVGHRRWLLNPFANYFGIGLTNSSSAIRVTNNQDTTNTNPHWVSWPSKGYFPNTIEPNGRWSLSNGNSKFKFMYAKVRVVHNGVSIPVTKYAVDNNYGKPTIVWQMPAGFEKAGTYSVSVTGGTSNGTVYNHSYSVTFFTPY